MTSPAHIGEPCPPRGEERGGGHSTSTSAPASPRAQSKPRTPPRSAPHPACPSPREGERTQREQREEKAPQIAPDSTRQHQIAPDRRTPPSPLASPLPSSPLSITGNTATQRHSNTGERQKHDKSAPSRDDSTLSPCRHPALQSSQSIQPQRPLQPLKRAIETTV